MNQADRAKRKARRQKIASLGLGLIGLVGLVGGVGWGILGTSATALAVFAGSVLTLGLAAWPIGILGLLVSWGPVFLLSALARGIDPIIRNWANHEEEPPELIKLREHGKGFYARTYEER